MCVTSQVGSVFIRLKMSTDREPEMASNQCNTSYRVAHGIKNKNKFFVCAEIRVIYRIFSFNSEKRHELTHHFSANIVSVCVCVCTCSCLHAMLLLCVCTSNPCLRTLKVDRGPRPQATYNCGVSSLAKSAICQKQEEKETMNHKELHCF